MLSPEAKKVAGELMVHKHRDEGYVDVKDIQTMKQINFEQGKERRYHTCRRHASIHILPLHVIELGPGRVFPAFQSLGIHPYLYRTVHSDLLLFTNRLGNLMWAAPIHPVRNNHTNPA